MKKTSGDDGKGQLSDNKFLSSKALGKANAMSSGKSSMNGKNSVGYHTQISDILNRHSSETSSISTNLKRNENLHCSQDQEAMVLIFPMPELYSRARAQKDEILLLREQIANASIKEVQLLKENSTLERKFAELRMALDEKQGEVISSASNELVRRKGDLEENIRLAHELKVAEEERYVFMSSIQGLLAEYGVWPRVNNASTLSNSVMHLHDQLQLKIRTSHALFVLLLNLVVNLQDLVKAPCLLPASTKGGIVDYKKFI
ncbi:unnamed protein product [Ilex paraguariensis]|uniref:Uncharacterized protein n=1 Tax=Ilex paraguariensis TaxID=185542 RepID=A0ABC8RIQ2_9AQUA